MLYLLAGDGDDDVLLGDAEEKEEKASLSKGERSHLIVWEVSSPEWAEWLDLPPLKWFISLTYLPFTKGDNSPVIQDLTVNDNLM